MSVTWSAEQDDDTIGVDDVTYGEDIDLKD